MAKRKGATGTKVTLKDAKKALRMKPDGWRRLTLSNMGITIFPQCLFKLTNMDELDLSRNDIKKLPEGIGKLSSLRWLDMHSNKLESVPESIGQLVGLTYLNLCNNRLTSTGLPSTLASLTKLKSLNLGLNKLNALLPTMVALESLQELALFDNLFTRLPEFVKALGNLTKVNIQRNPLLKVVEDDEEMETEKSDDEDNVFLVHESRLCNLCFKKCKDPRGNHKKVDCVRSKLEEMRSYSGLVTPNSVAAVNQDVWRVRS
ncbi:leucine-rich repeat-containing protein 18 [Nerophis ophidion]|uniref:leucine-rich repeat-containing protein 18 n=1 Tax=Nerophis ophidion TaxID=159077 RepID=UPI002ADF7B5B|nr:leucine-rich repeat-containing protein 18 [Nerophis ophidion]XP_061766241.1 leucine-rich repeat-containing protein 18 [Nerophis ophidion]XP_061766242.1 leucine-rich repeat-containing protein 18 [Nerophis ophidion]